MATQQAPQKISVPAGSDLSTKQYFFMNISSGKLALSGAGARVAGVLCDKPDAAGKAGSLQIGGVAKVIAGDSVTAGVGVSSDGAGKAVATGSGDLVAGIAMEDAASGEIFAVLLTGTGSMAGAGALEETITTGALTPGKPITYLSVTGTKAYSLADGEFIGQRKTVECTVAASTPLGTLTLNDAYGSEPLTHVFTAVGQRLDLEWRTGGWKTMGKRRAGQQDVVVGTTVLTGYDMAYRYNLSVTGTVSSTDTKAIPDGLVAGETIDIQVGTAASCPVGSISLAGEDLDGGAATAIAAIDGTTTHHARLMWTGLKWQALSITGLTIS